VHLFRSFILRFLRREPLRAGVTVLGVALGVAVVVAIRLANASSLRGFETALDAMSGRTSVEIVGAGVGIDEDVLPGLGWLREFGAVSPVIEGDAIARAGDTSEMMRVLGVDVLRDRPLREYQLTGTGADAGVGGQGGATPGAGAAPMTAQDFLSLLLDPHAVILTERYARRHGLQVGSRLALVFGDRERTLTVRALLRDEGPARVLDGNLALMDIAAAQWAFDRLGRIDRIDVRLQDASSIDRAEREIAARLPEGLTAQRPARRGEQVERMLAAFHLNLTALSLIALLVGVFLVYNTISTSVIVRREEIGTLRAVGVGRLTVLALFLGEAVLLGVIGASLGVGLGRVLADFAVGLTSATVSALYVANASAPPALTWRETWVAMAVAVPLSLAAAALPALEAARVSPLASMRGADRIASRFRLRSRQLLTPVALLALGGWLATRPAIGGMPVAGFGAAFALVFGAAFLVPLVLFALGRLGRVTLARAFGVEGVLANANLAGAIPRLSISVAALAVSLSMMVAIAIMIGSFRETVSYWVTQTLRADLYVGPSARANGARQPTVSAEVEQIVLAQPDVAAVDRFRNVSVPYGGSQVFLVAGDFAVMLERGRLLFKAPADAAERMRAAIGADAVVVSETFANRYARRVDDDVELQTPAGPRRFRIAAVYYDYSSDRGIVAMDEATFTRHFGAWRPTGVSVYLEAGTDADAARERLLRSLGTDQRIYVYTNASLRAEVLRIFDATFAITYALELIAIVVAIMGVAGTLVTLILERRKEIAMLRLVGADRRQVRRTVVLEAAMLGGVSQAIGLGVGLLLSLVLIFVVNVQSFGWTIQFHVPWLFLAQMSLAILVATALSGLYPARLASRMAVVGEVGEE
jgi:putative ABC transport system permease protein